MYFFFFEGIAQAHNVSPANLARRTVPSGDPGRRGTRGRIGNFQLPRKKKKIRSHNLRRTADRTELKSLRASFSFPISLTFDGVRENFVTLWDWILRDFTERGRGIEFYSFLGSNSIRTRKTYLTQSYEPSLTEFLNQN